MPTDFFERQDTARRNTVRLVVLFALAVLALIASIDLLLAATLGYLERDPATGAIDWSLAADPQVVVLAVAGTLLVVGGGSLYKVAQLRGGGHVVAEQLGGRRLPPDSDVAAEQRLLNVVQEMAIASGMPTPPVYLLEHEQGINAFAAGFTPSDAVIGITKGAVEQLSRDELQGVIAHEFSHILNGDMRLNIRLIGLLHGILIIGMLGYFLLRMTAFSGYRRRRSRQDNSALPLLALGAGLMAVGFFGTLFGNLIKAAVSRQREFLADAAAVQFTRQPEGIAGALRKIGGLPSGSGIQSPNAPEASHMFFGRATGGFSSLFSTHPPLAERIRRIEPSWDGTLAAVPETLPVGEPGPMSAAAGAAAMAASENGAPRPTGASAPPSGSAPAMGGGAAAGARAGVEQIGQPDESHLRYAARLLDSLPAALVGAAHEPYGARAVIYALLLDRRPAVRERQIARLAEAADPDVFRETERLASLVDRLDVRARLPLLDITLPALRGLTAAQYQAFKANVTALVQADRALDAFEWSLQRILLHDLEAQHARRPPPQVRRRTLASVKSESELLLSMLAYEGHRDLESARRAFDGAQRSLGLPDVALRPGADLQIDALDAAVAALEEAAPQVKRQVLHAAVASIAADRDVTAAEAELLRALSASLGAPMPPILQL